MPQPAAITIIVNPVSGAGKGRRTLPKVVRRLRSGLPTTQIRVIRTRSFADAVERATFAVRHAEGTNDMLVMLGGDGMVNIGINACVGTQVPLGVIPAGTGDDFARGVGVPRTAMAAAGVIVAGHTKTIDVMRVTARDYEHYVGTIVATGYDARVNARVNRGKVNLGSLSYLQALASEVRRLVPLGYRLRVNGVRHDVPALLLAVGNTTSYGGGIGICPNADPADGLLDVTLVHPASRRYFLSVLPKIVAGRFADDPHMQMFRTDSIEIDGQGLLPMGDGEILVPPPLTVSCVPAGLEVVVPR